MCWTCSCKSPPAIHLTEQFLPSPNSETRNSADAKEALRSTLSKYGWCHVAVDSSNIKNFQSFSKGAFVELFEKEKIASLESDGALYRGRTAESGSSETADAEPKQSWEVQRCSSSKNSLHQWMNALHSIALQVTKMLSLPENTFLQEDACSQQESCDGCNEKCNADLLRIFLYDPVHPALGSSPHTDWGSWTVVWQDDMGGLQTYCPLHETYVDVRAPQQDNDDDDDNSNLINFVVHVGDVTSLALGHAVSNTRHDEKVLEQKKVAFPSPRHRVICPQNEPRVSLVYFAYPPPSLSLANMEERMANHSIVNGSNNKVYDSYYLLQNQTQGGEVEDPEQVYWRIRTKPLGECFREKWKQVQRAD